MTVLEEYEKRLRSLQGDLSQAQSRQSAMTTALVASTAGFLLFAFGLSWFSLLWLPVVAVCLRSYLRSRRRSLRFWRLCRFYEAGLDRLKGTWQGKGFSGEEFSTPEHIYERGLNIFGRGSIFELLCTSRTEVGQRSLASYLLDLPEVSESVARQEAVQELRPRADLREETCLLGDYTFQDCEWEPFRIWLDAPGVTVSRLVPWIMALNSSLLGISVLLAWASHPVPGRWTELAPFLLPMILIQAAFGFLLKKRIKPVLHATRQFGRELAVLRQGLVLLDQQNFAANKLRKLLSRLRDGDGAAAAVRKLERLVRAVDDCDKQWFYAFSRILLIGSQLALAIERWKERHKEDLKDWLAVWGEFEALNALACYGHEHPDDVFPDLIEGAIQFEARGLGHPLLAESVGVRNDVELNTVRKFYLVSGSNMAGKSTLLRAIGINAVLASAGAPIRAFHARLSGFAVCASFSVVDSLADGKSHFMAEVERLREMLRSAAGPKPVLFVIDEILSGTNSRDRRTATESFVRALIGAGAIGALSTHDLALTEIANEPELCGSNVHMESRDPSDPFAFDYVLKPGVSTHSSALAIAKLAGVVV
jgi:MutS domain V